MNEIIFFIHLFFVILFGLAALRLGKEALTVWIALQAILANLFVTKQIDLFGFHVTASDALAIGSLASLNLLQEYFGKQKAQLAIWISFAAMLFFALLSQIHLFYEPNCMDTTQGAFTAILSSSPRLLLASLFCFLIVQKVDRKIFQRLPFALPLKSGISLFSSQLLDTVLFSFLGLYGIVSSLSDLIVMSFILKVMIILCLTPLTAFSRRYAPLPL